MKENVSGCFFLNTVYINIWLTLALIIWTYQSTRHCATRAWPQSATECSGVHWSLSGRLTSAENSHSNVSTISTDPYIHACHNSHHSSVAVLNLPTIPVRKERQCTRRSYKQHNSVTATKDKLVFREAGTIGYVSGIPSDASVCCPVHKSQ